MYTVTHSKLQPITVSYNGTGVIPQRIIVYRKVRKIRAVGTSLGVQYGLVLIAGVKRVVMRHNVAGIWQQWEVVH